MGCPPVEVPHTDLLCKASLFLVLCRSSFLEGLLLLPGEMLSVLGLVTLRRYLGQLSPHHLNRSNLVAGFMYLFALVSISDGLTVLLHQSQSENRC